MTTTLETLFSPGAALAFVAIGVIGSLFACKTWTKRAIFSLVTPSLYGFLWIISGIAYGVFFGLFGDMITANAAEAAAIVLASMTTAGCFIVQVVAMSHDPKVPVYGSAHGRMPKRERLWSPMRKGVSTD